MAVVEKILGRVPWCRNPYTEGKVLYKGNLVTVDGITYEVVADVTTATPSADSPDFRVFAGVPVGRIVALEGTMEELAAEVWPLTVDFAVTPAVVKAGAAMQVHASWSARRKGRNVTAEAAVELNGETASGSATDMELTLGHGEVAQFELAVEHGSLSAVESRSVRGTHPTYFGAVAADWTGDEAAIKALGELTVGQRGLTRTGIAVEDGRIALAYPKDFGALASVKDGNGYEVLSSYTRSDVSVGGAPYYLYLLAEPVTASGVKQIYS